MTNVPYTNNGKTPVTVGGKTIIPGETRDVDARFVPAPVAVNSRLVLLFINLSETSRYFGDVTVEPGDFARVSANYFVDPNTSADQAQADIFRAFLGQSLSVIKPHLSVFTDDELNVLVELEEAEGKNARKGLFEMIDTELAVRIAERDFSPAVYAEYLQTLTDEDLDLELLQVADDEVKLPLVQDELSDRKASRKES